MDKWKSPLVYDTVFGSKKRFGVLLFFISLLIYIYSSAHGLTLTSVFKKIFPTDVASARSQIPGTPTPTPVKNEKNVSSPAPEIMPQEVRQVTQSQTKLPKQEQTNDIVETKAEQITVGGIALEKKEDISIPLPIVTAIATVGPAVEQVVNTVETTLNDTVDVLDQLL